MVSRERVTSPRLERCCMTTYRAWQDLHLVQLLLGFLVPSVFRTTFVGAVDEASGKRQKGARGNINLCPLF